VRSSGKQEPVPGERAANVLAIVVMAIALLVPAAALFFFWFGYSMSR
jgi:hypothetical protein